MTPVSRREVGHLLVHLISTTVPFLYSDVDEKFEPNTPKSGRSN
jgi:hypothetical protein